MQKIMNEHVTASLKSPKLCTTAINDLLLVERYNFNNVVKYLFLNGFLINNRKLKEYKVDGELELQEYVANVN
jgi:hypothetical protein